MTTLSSPTHRQTVRSYALRRHQEIRLVARDYRLLVLFGQLHALGCTGTINGVTELGKLGAVTLLLLMHIVGAQTGEKIALIAVHIAQRLETVLLAAVKEPVDRTLLIGFQMVA